MKSRLIFLNILIVVSLLVAGCGPDSTPTPSEAQQPIATEPPFTFPETIGALSQERTEAENAVLQVQRDYADNAMGDYQDDKYNHAISLYGDARVAFNSWIDEVRAGLTSSNYSSTARDSQRLQQAVEKKKLFLDFVDAGYEMTRGAQSFNPAVLAPFIAPLASVAIDIWEHFRNVDAERIEQMRTRLEEQKWKSWDQIQ